MSRFARRCTSCATTRAGYGSQRMTKALQRQGWQVNHKRVDRVMRQAGLTCRRKPRYVHTTDSHHGEPVYANLVKDLVIQTPNQCWVADLTFVRLPEGFASLVCLLDASTRKCIGWSLARKMDSRLPLQALEMALEERQISAGLIHHSDRGREYCSFAYVNRLDSLGIHESHVHARQADGERTHGKFLQNGQMRGGVPASLPDVRGGTSALADL
jgi:putative transposase